jgi:hypothetical protein
MKTSSAYAPFLRLAGWMVCLSFLGLPFQGVRASRLGAIVPVTTTIQAAIDAAHDGDTISIPAGTYNESLTIDKNLILVGAFYATTTVQAVSNQRVITVQPGHNLTIKELTLTGGRALNPGYNEGGGVQVQNSVLTIDHCYIMDNQADYGGAVFQGGTGQVILKNNSYISGNHANIHGGGIYANNDLIMNASSLEANTATFDGGGATVWAGNLLMVGGTASYNQAGRNGGAFNVNNSVSVDQGFLFSNTADSNGGAILQWNGDDPYSVIIQHSTFEMNVAKLTGGAVSIAQGAATTIIQSQFKNNRVENTDFAPAADTTGGAINFSDTSWGHNLTIDQTSFKGNFLECPHCSYPKGGGLYALMKTPGLASLTNDTFTNNDGWLGGGIYASATTINGVTFQGNTAGSGGGAYLTGAAQILKSAFLQNSVVNNGGGLVVDLSAPSLSMEDTKFVGNSGGYDFGGAIHANALLITMKNVAVADTQVVHGGAIKFDNVNAEIDLKHITVNDTHLSGGSRAGTYGIHINDSHIVNIWNSMITSQGTGVKIEPGRSVSLYNTLWYDNMINIDGAAGSYADYDAVFSNPAYAVDRYHLTVASGAINQGVDRMVYQDIDGDLRDSLPDLGADEYRAHVYLPRVSR